jgi:hypothetical protein
LLTAGALLASPLPGFAQQPSATVARIGFLGVSTAAAWAPRVDAFRAGLRDLGYVEGTNIVIEFRFAEGKYDHLPELAAELVRLKVDVIGLGARRPRREAGRDNPIPVAVMSAMRWVRHCRRPRPAGGSITATRSSLPARGKTLVLDAIRECGGGSPREIRTTHNDPVLVPWTAAQGAGALRRSQAPPIWRRLRRDGEGRCRRARGDRGRSSPHSQQ